MTIVVVCGPSGAGKTMISTQLLQLFLNCRRIESYTTRAKRDSDPPGEYVYLSEWEFDKLDREGYFLWSVGPFGNKYGTAKSSLINTTGKNDMGIMILVPNPIILGLLRDFAKSNGIDLIHFYFISPGQDVLRKRLSKPDRSNEDIEKRIKECLEWDSWALREYASQRINFGFIANDKEGDITQPVNSMFNIIVRRMLEASEKDRKTP